MKGKTIFEIPIYSISKDEFESRWKIKKETLYKGFIEHGNTAENARRGVSDCFYPRWLWKYNQIVGYIEISVTRCDVNFDLYCSMDRQYRIDSKSRHYIEDWSINGVHFRIEGKTNLEIREDMRTWLCYIQDEHLHGRFYMDYSVFDGVVDFLHIRGIADAL